MIGHFPAVVASVTASHAVQSAGENTVLDTFGEVLHGLSSVSQGTVDTKRSAQCPAACLAVQVTETTGFQGVPGVNTLGDSTGLLGTAIPVATLFAQVHSTKCSRFIINKGQ